MAATPASCLKAEYNLLGSTTDIMQRPLPTKPLFLMKICHPCCKITTHFIVRMFIRMISINPRLHHSPNTLSQHVCRGSLKHWVSGHKTWRFVTLENSHQHARPHVSGNVDVSGKLVHFAPIGASPQYSGWGVTEADYGAK